MEEMGKVLITAGSFHEHNASATSYGSTCNLHLKAEKFAIIQDLINSLTDLSTWMDNVWRGCLNGNERLCAYGKQNFVQSDVLTSPKDAHAFYLLQFEMIRKAVFQSVSEVVERSNLDAGLRGQLPGFSTLMKSISNLSRAPSYKRKKSCVGNVSRKAANTVSPVRKVAFLDQAKYVVKCAKNKKLKRRDGFGMDNENSADFNVCTTHKMLTGDLESWIVKHSMPSKIREHKILSDPKGTEEIGNVCLESGKEMHIVLEVDLSQGGGFLLEDKTTATDHMPKMLYVKKIMETISLSRVNLDGHDKVIVLFKALR